MPSPDNPGPHAGAASAPGVCLPHGGGGEHVPTEKTTANVITGLRYHDAPAAIDWLCRAFGFERHLVVPGEQDGVIAHAQLRFGNGMVMLGSAGKHGGAFDGLMTTPREIGWPQHGRAPT